MLARALLAVFLRELQTARHSVSGQFTTPLLYFAAVILAGAFAFGPLESEVERAGPALIWLAAMLALLLSLDGLFAGDACDGTLDLLMISGVLPVLIFLAKVAALWMTSALPLIFAAPLACLMLNTDTSRMLWILASLAIGTPALALIGAVGAALVTGIARSGWLCAILVLPLCLPVLIFALAAVHGAGQAEGRSAFMLLIAVALFALLVCPPAGAAALKFRNQGIAAP